jgi:hypothetical protein
MATRLAASVSNLAPYLLHSNNSRHREIALAHPTTQDTSMSIFDEKYRVIGIEGDRLTLRGVQTGDILTIVPPEPQEPLSRDEYPVGRLIALSDPSERVFN